MPRWLKDTTAFVLLALTGILTFLAWYVADSTVTRRAELAFDSDIRFMVERVERRIAAYELVLAGLEGLFQASREVTQNEWRDYVGNLRLAERLPGVGELGYAPYVGAGELGAHLGLVERLGVPRYAISPPGERAAYVPVVYLKELGALIGTRNGFDLYADPLWRAAMQNAADRREPTLSAAVYTVHNGDRHAALRLFMPILAAPDDSAAVAGSENNVVGFVFVTFHVPDMLEGLIHAHSAQLGFDVYDSTSSERPQLLFEGGKLLAGERRASRFEDTRTVAVEGRAWTFVFRSSEIFETAHHVLLPTYILIVGCALAILLGCASWTRSIVLERTQRIAENLAREMSRSQAQFQDLFRFAPSAIVLVRQNGQIVDINPAGEQTFGYTREELIELPVETLVPDRLRPDVTDFRSDYAANPMRMEMALYDVEVTGLRKDGSVFPAEVTLVPLPSGLEPVVAAGIRDLSEKIAVEAQIRQAQKMESVGRLSGGIAHDFNNLLTIAVTNLDMLAESELKDDPQKMELLQAALGSALRGAELTRKLLAFARQQPENLPASRQVAELKQRLPTFVGWLTRTLGEHISVDLRVADDLWSVRADPAQIEDAVLNLALNARDAMPNGGVLAIEAENVLIDADYVEQAAGLTAGEYVLLSVSDTGTGMPSEVAEQAFEPFFTTKEPGKGTGLGLSMIYGFAKQAGGDLRIDSVVGHGTTLRLYLPRSTGDVQQGETQPSAPPLHALPHGSETILLVEDNDEVRAAARRILVDLGYRLAVADTGPAALAILDSGRPFDLLFTDVVMPEGMDGYELAAAARERRPDLRVLITTGYARGADASGKHERYPVLRKPYRRQDLAMHVRAVLDAAR